MLAYEKKQAVLDFVRTRQMCATREIVEQLGIPKVTAHRLLTELEDEQLLEKFHGGVRISSASSGTINFNRRLAINTEAKDQIGRRAAELVEPGSTIFLDASTTGYHLARYLGRAGGPPCGIISPSATLCHELCGSSHLRLVCTGGELNHELNLLGGSLALQAISKLNFSDAFLSAGGASLQHGATTWETDVITILTAVKTRAARSYLLVDASKFTKVAPLTIAPLREFTAVITDGGLPEDTRAALLKAGVNLL